jgi:hypothetical protein
MKEFDNMPDAFDYCRDGNSPCRVIVKGETWKLFPSGRAENLSSPKRIAITSTYVQLIDTVPKIETVTQDGETFAKIKPGRPAKSRPSRPSRPRAMPGGVTVTTKLDVATLAKLDAVAETRVMSRAAVIREAIERALAKKKS